MKSNDFVSLCRLVAQSLDGTGAASLANEFSGVQPSVIRRHTDGVAVPGEVDLDDFLDAFVKEVSEVVASESKTGGEEVLPDGWEVRVAATGRTYYAHHATKTTSWVHPVTGVPSSKNTASLGQSHASADDKTMSDADWGRLFKKSTRRRPTRPTKGRPVSASTARRKWSEK